jgi:V/A-type H+-transporting ATPase subunit D
MEFKLNKSELTRLKQEEKMYTQFLPVLKLKQEQLQIEKIRIKKKYVFCKKELDNILNQVEPNLSILTDIDNSYDIKTLVSPQNVNIVMKSIAGVKVPYLNSITFKTFFIHYFDAPWWINFVVKNIKSLIKRNIELQVIDKQYLLISKELKKATQKVNLFEKLLIPETKNAIKKINIVLGDEQVAAVGRAKTAKKKTIGASSIGEY